jgi:hypothetical protein
MASSNLPARVPERQPETTSTEPTIWPKQEKKTTRFVIKLGGAVPS